MDKYYLEQIKKLEIKSKYKKEDILTDTFLLEKDDSINIYFAPHNLYINKNAKIAIIGITPGWTQTEVAYRFVVNNSKLEDSELLYLCKINSRFAGNMRTNLINMLDEIGVNTNLKLKNSCSELFEEKTELLHTTSLIKFPVFINDNNYNGYSPNMLNNNLIKKYIYQYFIPEINNLNNNILCIPLGKSVERVLFELKKDGYLENMKILTGLPHPSPLNAHMTRIFNSNKDELKKQINEFFVNER